MSEILICACLILGALFVLIASIGLLTMPDLFTRMQTTAKAGTMGAVGVLSAVVLYFGELDVATHAALIIVFLFLTAPVASHMIARAAYNVGVPHWEGTRFDELAEDREAPGAEQEADSKAEAPEGQPEN